MAKWYGKIGYGRQVEVRPGVWKEEITEKSYYGDLNKVNRRLQTANQVNDDLTIANELSIVADPFANNHFHEMLYVEYQGVKWKVSYVDASQPPRLILTLGGVYNG